ncbi:protein arginine N-methyltransferase 5 [Rhizoctonia solani]|uniref:Protein arginine N-methyltransferase 5 n=1 Tax=Rhizoctonia solani TaxID=456999 RepID=A0A8H8NSZ2_9AGAM|nr:protein arginine N-methyltransferase 5 [Rhizoctonia solani]QRW18045.1 protein arginine N-methyltransferase 5 [Rhizoctonia solani]
MNRSTYSRFVTVGLSGSRNEFRPDYVPSDNIQSEIDSALSANYDSISISLANERWKTRWQKMCLSGPQTPPNYSDSLQGQRSPARIKLENTASGLFKAPSDHKDAEIEMEAELWRAGGGFQRDEVNIMRNDQAEHVIGFISDWLELDSQIEGVRYDSEIALRQELQYASYLGISNVILPPPRRGQEITTYARAVKDCLTSSAVSPYMSLSVRIPVCDIPPEDGNAAKGVSDYEDELSATWQMWNTIRMVCGPTQRVSVALDLTPALPASSGVLARWSAEHVQHLILPATTFIPNGKGYPVLPKLTQGFLRDLFKNRPNIILSKTQASLHNLGGELAYIQYVRHLEKTSPFNVARDAPDGLTVESFGRGYEDYLQAPLQPLMDNLASMTYEVFEKDPVKYRQYEQAVYRALLDQSPESTTIICVAGAGRGPIVSNCIRAVERSGRDARIYAIEKNPSAFVTLQGRKAREWPDFVHIKFGDMRTVQLPEPVDILVSELLGSFGDNELSPECLDGAMRLLKPEGISIPASYTAYLAPISASRLYNDPSGLLRETKGAETPYVVMLHAINTLSGDEEDKHPRCGPKIQDCWTFEHPRKIVLDPQALPGGKTDPMDASPVATALREANEEIGLPVPSSAVHVLGVLTPFVSYYKLAVTPVIAFLSDLSLLEHLKPNPEEVDEIFDHPLEAILSPELAASLAPKPGRLLSERGSEKWRYEPEYHYMRDSAWLHGSQYRMHKFRSVTTPISGLTSDILILAAKIAYVRNTDYERYAENHVTPDIALGWAMEQHAEAARATSQPQASSAESHIEGLAD